MRSHSRAVTLGAMETLYHPALYDDAQLAPSLWEAQVVGRPELGSGKPSQGVVVLMGRA